MFKRSLLLGLAAGVLAGLASVVYQHVYNAAVGADFSNIVTIISIIVASTIGSLLAALGYVLFIKWFKTNADRVFNLVYVIVCIITIVSPFAFKLPLTAQSPELFPGMTVPMHLFPPLAWLTLHPFFFKQSRLSETAR